VHFVTSKDKTIVFAIKDKYGNPTKTAKSTRVFSTKRNGTMRTHLVATVEKIYCSRKSMFQVQLYLRRCIFGVLSIICPPARRTGRTQPRGTRSWNEKVVRSRCLCWNHANNEMVEYITVNTQTNQIVCMDTVLLGRNLVDMGIAGISLSVRLDVGNQARSRF